MARMLKSMMRGDLDLHTTLLIREVENGYVFDVDLEGDLVAHGSPERYPRFVKLVARSGLELENVVADLLGQFEKRKPHRSDRILGSMQLHQVERRVMVISRVDGGYLVDTVEPVKVVYPSDASEFIKTAMLPMIQDKSEDAGTACRECIRMERFEKILICMNHVQQEMTRFFGIRPEDHPT